MFQTTSKPRVSTIKEYILNSVISKENTESEEKQIYRYYERCLRASICPECGHDLDSKNNIVNIDDNYIIRFSCFECGFSEEILEDSFPFYKE